MLLSKIFNRNSKLFSNGLGALFCILSVLGFSSCSVNLSYEAPRDQMGDFCSGNFVNTPSACVDEYFKSSGIIYGGYYKCYTEYWEELESGGRNSYGEPSFKASSPVNPSCTYLNPVYLQPSDTDALIVVAEAGYIEAAATNTAALKSSYPTQLYPYFRTLQNNVFTAYLAKLLQTKGQRYGRIYIVRSDVESKSGLLSALQRVTNAHRKVDMLLTIHGDYGLWNLSPDLKTKLTSTELYNFAQTQMSSTQRNKIRAIFSTACFGATPYAYSMTTALVQAFPYSVAYGSNAINWAPMHRDFVAFESYYGGTDFYTAVTMGNNALNYNLVNWSARTQLNFPTVLGRGCADMGLWTQCENQSIALGSFAMNSSMTEESRARVSAGVNGNLYTRIANRCTIPGTSNSVIEGTVYNYYTTSTVFSDSGYTCSNYRRSATCTASGWSTPVQNPSYTTCTTKSLGGCSSTKTQCMIP